MKYIKSELKDGFDLAEIRALAMKPSLEAINRYDSNRVRDRFLDTFEPDETYKIIESDELLGFYVTRERKDHIYLDHLYIKPEHQNKKLGKVVLDKIIQTAKASDLPVRLCALKGSRSNDFYLKNGFKKTHESEFDIFYVYSITKAS
ncbi:GNAT family N-acetyltransferase [Endozoicomonas arenosclerae]|uniref:GNAT family N-acetyltransferase n=1 Tax=Endozoicomonas arenosclerae TaxID=1633495 RepID=UPI00078081B2|nr:GNAT family N-acetyltransferase [Endozoicomonas arenosclerae]